MAANALKYKHIDNQPIYNSANFPTIDNSPPPLSIPCARHRFGAHQGLSCARSIGTICPVRTRRLFTHGIDFVRTGRHHQGHKGQRGRQWRSPSINFVRTGIFHETVLSGRTRIPPEKPLARTCLSGETGIRRTKPRTESAGSYLHFA